MKNNFYFAVLVFLIGSCTTFQSQENIFSVEVNTVGNSTIHNIKIKTLLFDPIAKVPVDPNNMEIYQYKTMIDKALTSIGFVICDEEDYDFDEVILVTIQMKLIGLNRNGDMEYIKVITLESTDARYFQLTGEFKNIWYTRIVSIGSADELNDVIPVLLLSSTKYIAKNTRGIKRFKVSANYDTSFLYE